MSTQLTLYPAATYSPQPINQPATSLVLTPTWNLAPLPSGATVLSVIESLTFAGPGGLSSIHISAPFWAAAFDSSSAESFNMIWNATGLSWLQANAGQPSQSPGNITVATAWQSGWTNGSLTIGSSSLLVTFAQGSRLRGPYYAVSTLATEPETYWVVSDGADPNALFIQAQGLVTAKFQAIPNGLLSFEYQDEMRDLVICKRPQAVKLVGAAGIQQYDNQNPPI